MRQTPHRLARRAAPFRFESSAFIAVLPGVPGLALAMGIALVATVPAARGFSETFGWMPLWLLGMPLTAWWALHRFRLPQRATVPELRRARRRPHAQARRRTLRAGAQCLPRAA